MARSLEDNLQALREIEDDPRSERGLQELRRVLKLKSSFAVARAAAIVGAHSIDELTAELGRAFLCFFEKPTKTDKNCKAKESIAEALYNLGADDEHLFLRGIRHVQLEPVWGGSGADALS